MYSIAQEMKCFGVQEIMTRSIVQDHMKCFDLQDIMTRDDYSLIVGQSKFGKALADADEHWKHKNKNAENCKT